MPKTYCPFHQDIASAHESKLEEKRIDGDEILATCMRPEISCDHRENYSVCGSVRVCPHARYTRKEEV